MSYSVYVVRNRMKNPIYVGMTSNFPLRERVHEKSFGKGCKVEQLTWHTQKKDALKQEGIFIKAYTACGYNLKNRNKNKIKNFVLAVEVTEIALEAIGGYKELKAKFEEFLEHEAKKIVIKSTGIFCEIENIPLPSLHNQQQ